MAMPDCRRSQRDIPVAPRQFGSEDSPRLQGLGLRKVPQPLRGFRQCLDNPGLPGGVSRQLLGEGQQDFGIIMQLAERLVAHGDTGLFERAAALHLTEQVVHPGISPQIHLLAAAGAR